MPVSMLPELGTAGWPADLDERARQEKPKVAKPVGGGFASTKHGTRVPAKPIVMADGTPCPVMPREREAALLIAEGLTDREIGRRMGISHGTAKLYVGRLLQKLGCRNRVILARLIFAEQFGPSSVVEVTHAQ